MCAPSAPPTPDYKGAAEATAAGNRTNQFTPFGSLTYGQSGTDAQGNPTYSQTLSLAPDQQQLLNTQNQTSLGLSNLQGQGLQAVQNLFNNLPQQQGTVPDFTSSLPASVVAPGQTAQNALLAREMPILNQQQDRLNNQLANQGIQVGSDAYGTSQKLFGQQMNDAISQAALQGINVDQQARQQAMSQNQQQLADRQQTMNEQGFYSQIPINLLNAIRTGSQVQSPTFAATPAGANYLGAAQAQGQGDLNAYNAQTGANNSMMGGLMGLGAAGLMAPAGTFTGANGLFTGLAALSDVRLKSNIVKVGEHPKGFGVYEYDINGRRERGVLAQEVEKILPEAVTTGDDGFKRVFYGML